MNQIHQQGLSLPALEALRRKLDGGILSRKCIESIVRDIFHGRCSIVELTAFVIACSRGHLSKNEIVYLTEVMIETGQTIQWDFPQVFDKHCIGGVPGNRTTMIVVPIVAAFGLPIPKTSSRAITSPAGTADTMETLTNVSLSLGQIQKIVSKEKGCIAWGGALSLAPVDDVIISVERPLSLDSEGQMVASILSKKKAAGSTHVLIDIPVGPNAKVTHKGHAMRLKLLFEQIARRIRLKIRVVITDGRQPIGQGVGPVLEAMDVLKVLLNEYDAPADLKKKALFLAGEILEMSGRLKKGQGTRKAAEILESGEAYNKFISIAGHQGKLKALQLAKYEYSIRSVKRGKVDSIHTRKIATLARLAGAPTHPKAGILIHTKLNEFVLKGQVVMTLFAESKEKLNLARRYVRNNLDIIKIISRR